MPITIKVSIGQKVAEEVPTPATDGVETEFSTASSYIAGTLRVFRDQAVLKGAGTDFTETDPDAGTFTLTTAPDADEVLWVRYVKR